VSNLIYYILTSHREAKYVIGNKNLIRFDIHKKQLKRIYKKVEFFFNFNNIYIYICLVIFIQIK